MSSLHKTKIRLPSTGPTYIVTRLSRQYSSEYPTELEGLISESEFFGIMIEINETLSIFWPCPLCWWFSHIAAFVTFGFAILLLLVCISQAEENLKEILEETNLNYRGKGVKFEIKRGWFSSWLEIDIPGRTSGWDWEKGNENKSLSGAQGFVSERFIDQEMKVISEDFDEDISSEEYNLSGSEGTTSLEI